jgi:predicted nucleic acid-binding protein
MNDKFFLDTNLLIYSFDSREFTKQQQAQHLIVQALSNQKGIISFQVVQEFLNAARRKFANPLSATDCQTYLTQVLMPLCQAFPQLDLYQKALIVEERYRYSFYDSLILAAALQAHCQILYTEDLQAGQIIEQTLQIVNPFL